jgi:hypothetical protein
MTELMSNINVWVERTINFVRNENYLDKLLEIYPAEVFPRKPLPDHLRDEIVNLYNEKKYVELIILLINLKDFPFPIEHPYAALLRYLDENERSDVIRRNPELVEKLSNVLVSLGLNNIIRGIERSKDINRMFGAMFKSWVSREFRDAPFRVVKEGAHLLTCSQNAICIYAGKDTAIANFVKRHLHLTEPEKRFYNRDIIARVGNTYIIGEARFLSTPGGSQSRDLENTLRFVELMENISKEAEKENIKVKGIALMDGIIWFHKEYVDKIKSRAIGDRIVMSALFLKEYLLSIFNKRS